MEAYLAMELKRNIDISAFGIERTVPFDYLDGLIGVMLVFNSREAAEKYTDGEILTVETIEKEATSG